MNREIKFRAWDSLKKEMIAEGYHVIGEVTMFGLIDQWVDEHRGETPSLEYYNHIIEMQYTGLKDKNGKEIYYGDVVRGKESGYEDSGIRIKGWDGYRTGEVVWRDGNTYYTVGNQVHQQLMYMIKPEIIGNIYENPDLLSSDKNVKASVATEDASSKTDD